MTILIYGFDFSIIKKIVLYTCRGDEILQLHIDFIYFINFLTILYLSLERGEEREKER